MIKLFQYPPASRSEIGKGVLVRMIPALLVLILSTIPLFIFIGKDSAANRDAVRKVTSQETEVAAAAVFIVFLLCIHQYSCHKSIGKTYEKFYLLCVL